MASSKKTSKPAKQASAKSPAEGKKKVALRSVRKKTKKVLNGVVHVQATFNNTLITVADPQGKALIQSSAGAEGFKGSRKSTPFAAQVAAEKVAKASKETFSMISVIIRIKGPGPGRDAVIKTFIALGFKITEIRDVTGIPHNGPRPPKKRRV